MGALDTLRGLAGLELHVARLLRTGLFDPEWLSAQTGVEYPSPRAAARAYLAAGRRQGYSPHPLFEPDHVDRGGRREALRHYLDSPEAWNRSPHPLFDVKAAAEQLRTAQPGEAAGSAWARWAASATPQTMVPAGKAMPARTWGELRGILLASAREWRESRSELTAADWHAASTAERVAGRTSIVVPAAADHTGLSRQLRWLQRAPAGSDWELALAGVRSRAHWAFLRANARGSRLVLVAAGAAAPSAQLNAAAAASGGGAVILAHPDVVLDADLVSSLSAAVADPAVAVAQPLNVHADSTVFSAGAWFPGDAGPPEPLLRGHRVEDGARIGRSPIPGVFSTVVAFRPEVFLALSGLDPAYGQLVGELELSLRAHAEGLGQSWLVPEARVTVGSIHGAVATPEADPASLDLLRQRWPDPPPGSAEALARAGFRPAAPGGERAGVPRLARLELPDLAAGAPRLRWALDIAAPVGPRGATWGDRHFARALADALARLGQDVTIDHREARGRASRVFDDVVLVLRGRDQVVPPSGPLSLLWVISHPDAVTAEEASGFDAVFAASSAWAKRRAGDWGLDIQPLLQCTDPAVFNPGRAAPDSGPEVLFVGNSRGVARPAVVHAIAAGAPLQVYGDGWAGLIPDGFVTATSAANDEVAELYASAGVVLNDHWEDMRRDGFLSNRLFDAVACGARVASDPVLGLSEVFGDSVRVFESGPDLAGLLTPPFDRSFPGRAAREREAARIAVEHSFDARAQALLATALDGLRRRAT